MNVKRYFAQDMQEALDKIKKELGPDAVILNSRTMRKKGVLGIFAKPLVEVVVAYEQEGESHFSKTLSEALPPADGKQGDEFIPFNINKRENPAVAGDKARTPRRPLSQAEKILVDGPDSGKVRRLVDAQEASARPASAAATERTQASGEARVAESAQVQAKALESVPKRPRAVENVRAQARAVESASERPVAIDRVSDGQMTREQAQAGVRAGVQTSAQASAQTSVQASVQASGRAIDNRPYKNEQIPRERAQAGQDISGRAYAEPASPAFSAQTEAALREAMSPSLETRAAARRVATPQQEAGEDSSKLLGMERRIVEMQSMLLHLTQRRSQDTSMFSDSIMQLYERLKDNEVHENIASGLARETQEIVEKLAANPQEVMEQLISDKLGRAAPLHLKPYQRNVVIMTGPTGVGKTTTLVKLAAYFAYRKNAKVAMINNDTYRVGAQEQLRTYAEILSAPIHVTYTTDDVVDALKELTQYDLVFIDTSGRNPGDEEYKQEMSQLVRRCQADDIYLVISASTGVSTCREIIRHYSYLNQYKLLVTKTDETPTGGMILNAAAFSGMPLSYITTGQSVPDDIEIADPAGIVRKIMG